MNISLRNVISFSLYGRERLYCEGALRNAELAPIHYPGWICRFYVDDSVPQYYQVELALRGAQVVNVAKPSLGPMYGRYWRFLIAADQNISRYVIRDVDSRLNCREKAAVDEWISSGKSFHLMRDSANHRTRALAGMWGGVGGKLVMIAELIDRWGHYDAHGQNDRFVSEVLFPLMQNDYLCHDSAGYFDDGRPFPPHAPMTGTRYVGEIIDDDRPVADIWRQSAELENRLIREAAALADTQALALERFEEIKSLSERLDQVHVALADTQALALERFNKIKSLSERLDKVHAALADTQALALERADQIKALSERLDQTHAALADTQALARERADKIKLLSERLNQIHADP